MNARNPALLSLAAVLSILVSCRSAPTLQPASGTAGSPIPGATFLPAAAQSDRWVILLPGASGLTIFDDDSHYSRAAEALRQRGYATLILDYKAAFRAARDRPSGPTGNKIAWVIEQTVARARVQGLISPDSRGAIVAWSLGAEGLWPILADPVRAAALGLRAAAAYYPSNEDQAPIRTALPLLVFVGERDDVTPLAATQAALEHTDPALATLIHYPGALHGFDVRSIPKPRTISLIPILGPRATFGFDPAGAADAARRLESFLDDHMARP